LLGHLINVIPSGVEAATQPRKPHSEARLSIARLNGG